MTAAAWALVVLFAVMLVLLVSILFYRDDAEEDDGEETVPAEDPAEDSFADELDLPQDVREMLDEQDNVQMPVQPEDTADRKDGGSDVINISSLLEDIQDDSEFDQEEIDTMFRENEPEFDLDQDVFASEDQQKETDQDISAASSDADIVRKGIAMAWQESEVIMSCHTFGSALLYEWEGLARQEKLILFDVRENGLAYQLMETARSISAANQKPACRFAVLIHTGSERIAENSRRALSFLREKNRTPAYLISDSANVSFRAEALKKYAFLAVGSCPVLHLTCGTSEDTALKIFKGAFEKYRISSLNETAAEAFTLIRNDFPLTIRRGLSCKGNAHAAFRKAVDLIPEIRGWGLPEVRTRQLAKGCAMTLRAVDDIQMESFLSLLQSEAARYNTSLRVYASQKASTAVSADSDAFKAVSEAVCACTDYEKVLPVLADTDFTVRSVPSVGLPYESFTRRQLYDILRKLICG